MKVIIPMSGIGKRFLDVGYTQPKPLLKVLGKPIIEYVVSMFPGDHSFVFICNEDHFKATDVPSLLKSLKPECAIVPIKAHSKGPVFAIAQAFDHISDDEEVMVSYCDYHMNWDFDDFQKKISASQADAAVPCYIGFHPHLIHGYLYASVLTDESGMMTKIKEKHCFTEKSTDCHQSAGAYYFRRGSDLKNYFQELMEKDMHLNGEYYVSTVYELLLRDGKKVFVPEIKHFLQFGTPRDLEEFEAWARYFSSKLGIEKPHSDIPNIREREVKIPVRPGTEEYKKSHSYWESFFKEFFAKQR